MNDTLQLEIALACQRLIAAFAFHVDHQHADGAADLFAPDATFERRGELLVGQDAIRAAMRKRPASLMTCHLCGLPHVEVIDAHNARAVTPFTVYRRERVAGATSPVPMVSAPELIGEYEDSFQRTPQGWRIRTRRATARFVFASRFPPSTQAGLARQPENP